MKRIHLVGKSDDAKSLVFTATKGGKRGSFVVPITPRLRELVAEDDASPSPGETRTESRAGRDHVRVLPAPPAAQDGASARGRGRGLAPGAFERATGFGSGVPDLRGVRALIGGGEIASRGHRIGLAAVPEPSDEGAATPDTERDTRASQVGPSGPEGRAASSSERGRRRMTAAEMQTLLRAGRSVRAVAKMSGATLDWVTRLDETIEMERIAVVRQLLGAHLTRDRLGESEVPVGEAILGNLRKRRVRFPERVLETGWSASRPPGKEWRVRFSYRYRDKVRRADWSYEPRTGEVLALNATGAELGWVAPTEWADPSGRRGRKPRGLKRRP